MKNLPAEIICRLYLTDSHGDRRSPYELDDELIDWDKVRYIGVAVDDKDHVFDIVRYSCSDKVNRLCAIYREPDITAEDLIEWQASSCGMSYNAYIGKPWED